MKFSVIYSLLTILDARGTSASCVEGHRETIAPGYTVEYKCDSFRTGDLHNNIDSDRDCALLCQAASRPVCSYHAATRRCIVGKENGKDTSRAGVSYMFKVEEPEEDPFAIEEEDPFAEDCETEKASLTDELAKCKAGASSSTSGKCSLRKRPTGDSIAHHQYINHPGCKQKCLENPKCVSYGFYVCNNICDLFDKPAEDLNASDSITHILNNKDCD